MTVEDDRYNDVAVETEPDPRIVAVHQVVDLEQQYEQATLEAERRQKTAAIVQNELREARDRLAGLLGYPSNAGKVPMTSEQMAYAARTSR